MKISSEQQLVELAAQYKSEFGPPIPLEYGEKEPVKGFKWSNYTDDELDAVLGKGRQNIAVRLDFLIDFDLDSTEAVDLAQAGLLPVAAVFGRPGKPCSHWLYALGEPTKYRKFSDPDPQGADPLLFEMRTGKTHYTRFPGSVHENGEVLEWVNRNFDRSRPLQKPEKIARCLAAACLLLRCWRPGHRDELDAALTSVLIEAEWPEDDIKAFIQAVAVAAKDDESHRRGKKYEYVARAAEDERRTFGWGKIQEIVGRLRAKQLRVWLATKKGEDGGVDPEALIDELNSKYALTNLHGKERVLEVVVDPESGYRSPAFKTVQDLHAKLASVRVFREGRRVNAAKVWLEHPRRRDLDGLTFEPYPPGRVLERPRHFNLFQGWPVAPVEGDCSLFLEHLLQNVCLGNEEHYRWLLGVLAHGIQRPAEKLGISIVLKGRQGVGKGKVVEWYGKLFGAYFLHVSQGSHLTGRFTGHLEAKLLVFADEAIWAGDKAAEGALKALITERESVIERKGIDAVRLPSFLRVIIASNNEWVVPAEPEERRFAVFEVSTSRMQDHEYFAAIDRQMNSGGLEALMHHLLNVNLDSITLRKIPRTSALAEQKEQSLDWVSRWWQERLWQGALYPEQSIWPVEPVLVGQLHGYYVEYCKNLGRQRIDGLMMFSKRLRELLPELPLVRPSSSDGVRKRAYVLPSLEDSRAAYDARMDSQTPWPEGSAAMAGPESSDY
jgi:hypothetical protein